MLIKDPWKIYMTTDHPNAAPFTFYPTIISWLLSRAAREDQMKKINERAQSKSLLPTTDREYTLYELAIATRAGQAKSLGLNQKGHLGVGADADIAIYNFNPEQLDVSKEYRLIRKAFGEAAYTIKNGQIVVKDGQIVDPIDGKTFWVKPELSNPLNEISPKLKEAFEDYYTVQYENYVVPEHHLAISNPIRVKTEV
jgi:formylmethanofuran dehydrogenase subunit A